MILFLRRLHCYIAYLFLIIMFLLTIPFALLFAWNVKTYPILNRVRSINGLIATWASGIFCVTERETKIDKSKNYVYCPNHTSFIDIVFMFTIADSKCFFMSKQSLLKVPLFYLYLKTIDVVVDRASKTSSYKAFKMAAEKAKMGMSPIIFPEGKIAHNVPHLNPFKDGPFRLAIEQGIDIIPVTFIDNWRTFPDNGLEKGSQPGITHAYIHAPVSVAGYTIEQVDELKQKVYDIINNKLQSNKFIQEYQQRNLQTA